MNSSNKCFPHYNSYDNLSIYIKNDKRKLSVDTNTASITCDSEGKIYIKDNENNKKKWVYNSGVFNPYLTKNYNNLPNKDVKKESTIYMSNCDRSDVLYNKILTNNHLNPNNVNPVDYATYLKANHDNSYKKKANSNINIMQKILNEEKKEERTNDAKHFSDIDLLIKNGFNHDSIYRKKYEGEANKSVIDQSNNKKSLTKNSNVSYNDNIYVSNHIANNDNNKKENNHNSDSNIDNSKLNSYFYHNNIIQNMPLHKKNIHKRGNFHVLKPNQKNINCFTKTVSKNNLNKEIIRNIIHSTNPYEPFIGYEHYKNKFPTNKNSVYTILQNRKLNQSFSNKKNELNNTFNKIYNFIFPSNRKKLQNNNTLDKSDIKNEYIKYSLKSPKNNFLGTTKEKGGVYFFNDHNNNKTSFSSNIFENCKNCDNYNICNNYNACDDYKDCVSYSVLDNYNTFDNYKTCDNYISFDHNINPNIFHGNYGLHPNRENSKISYFHTNEKENNIDIPYLSGLPLVGSSNVNKFANSKNVLPSYKHKHDEHTFNCAYKLTRVNSNSEWKDNNVHNFQNGHLIEDIQANSPNEKKENMHDYSISNNDELNVSMRKDKIKDNIIEKVINNINHKLKTNNSFSSENPNINSMNFLENSNKEMEKYPFKKSGIQILKPIDNIIPNKNIVNIDTNFHNKLYNYRKPIKKYVSDDKNDKNDKSDKNDNNKKNIDNINNINNHKQKYNNGCDSYNCTSLKRNGLAKKSKIVPKKLLNIKNHDNISHQKYSNIKFSSVNKYTNNIFKNDNVNCSSEREIFNPNSAKKLTNHKNAYAKSHQNKINASIKNEVSKSEKINIIKSKDLHENVNTKQNSVSENSLIRNFHLNKLFYEKNYELEPNKKKKTLKYSYLANNEFTTSYLNNHIQNNIVLCSGENNNLKDNNKEHQKDMNKSKNRIHEENQEKEFYKNKINGNNQKLHNFKLLNNKSRVRYDKKLADDFNVYSIVSITDKGNTVRTKNNSYDIYNHLSKKTIENQINLKKNSINNTFFKNINNKFDEEIQKRNKNETLIYDTSEPLCNNKNKNLHKNIYDNDDDILLLKLKVNQELNNCVKCINTLARNKKIVKKLKKYKNKLNEKLKSKIKSECRSSSSLESYCITGNSHVSSFLFNENKNTGWSGVKKDFKLHGDDNDNNAIAKEGTDNNNINDVISNKHNNRINTNKHHITNSHHHHDIISTNNRSKDDNCVGGSEYYKTFHDTKIICSDEYSELWNNKECSEVEHLNTHLNNINDHTFNFDDEEIEYPDKNIENTQNEKGKHQINVYDHYLLSGSSKRYKGEKKALLVTLNYNGMLEGCINDTLHMCDYLVDKFNFNKLTLLNDCNLTYKNFNKYKANKKNILKNLNNLITNSEYGDVLFFYFCGYSIKLINSKFSDIHNFALLPQDYSKNNYIYSHEIFNIIKKLEGDKQLCIILDTTYTSYFAPVFTAITYNKNMNQTELYRNTYIESNKITFNSLSNFGKIRDRHVNSIYLENIEKPLDYIFFTNENTNPNPINAHCPSIFFFSPDIKDRNSYEILINHDVRGLLTYCIGKAIELSNDEFSYNDLFIMASKLLMRIKNEYKLKYIKFKLSFLNNHLPHHTKFLSHESLPLNNKAKLEEPLWNQALNLQNFIDYNHHNQLIKGKIQNKAKFVIIFIKDIKIHTMKNFNTTIEYFVSCFIKNSNINILCVRRNNSKNQKFTQDKIFLLEFIKLNIVDTENAEIYVELFKKKKKNYFVARSVFNIGNNDGNFPLVDEKKNVIGDIDLSIKYVC